MKSLRIDIDAPTSLPLDLGTLKSDLRIDGGDMDMVLLEQYIPSAVQWAEGLMRRSIIAREHRWILGGFPDGVICLPRGITQSVASVAYSSGGVTTTLTGPSSGSPGGTDYQEDLRGHSGRIMPNRGESWPATDTDVLAPVVITFTAGWTTASLVPEDIKRALTARVFEEMELNGVLVTKSGMDEFFTEKLLSAWRIC